MAIRRKKAVDLRDGAAVWRPETSKAYLPAPIRVEGGVVELKAELGTMELEATVKK